MGVATMLDDGRVLAVGRLDATKAGRKAGRKEPAIAEIFDPSS